MDETTAGVAAADGDEISLLDLALVMAETWRTLVFVPLTGGILALAISFLIPPTFTAVTRILPPTQQQSSSAALAAQLGTLAGLAGSAAGLRNPTDQYVALLTSRSVYDAIVQRFKLNELYGATFLEDARKMLELRTRVFAGSKDGIISIEVEDHDPGRAAEIANAFVEELRNLTKTLAITEAGQRRVFFEEQLVQAKENLTKAEIALQGSGVSSATLRTVPQSALESLARLKAQITTQEIKLASMRTFMTDANPEFRVAVRELAALREELSKAEQSSPVKKLDNGAEYIAKYRDFKYHETLFELMAKQYEIARLDEAREGAVIQVVDRAMAPERKSKPRKAMIAIVTTLVIFALTLLTVFMRHAWRNATADPARASKVVRLQQLLHFHRG
ncbi:MAG: Wzz/FepE/Etk N-terminal domain-containing protein [Acidobacteriales bacterium]|nr:Wzz/FepE/Etk N-terminal domain-containing protein [Terriglobales bacterium]